jgi:4-amino-4-deoxy-L-arabinose transferase-like glycosyltransferase
MLIILPATAFVISYLNLREMGREWRWAILAAAVFCGSCTVWITEMLSIPRALSQRGIAISWLVICVVGLIFLAALRRRGAPHTHAAEQAEATTLDGVNKAFLVAIAFLVLIVGITAVLAPPNMWDSMEYHLPRVIMWMSNQSVRFYPTPDYSQLVFAPWAEYAMLHAHLLSGSDRFVNLVEFFSLIGSLVGVSLIAKILGAGPRGQIFAVIVCATIPEGVLEASGPMNTYVLSFWIMATVAFMLSWNEDPSWINTVCIGLSIGLALLTKGHAYLFLPPLILACWWMGSSRARLVFVKRSAVVLFIALALNAPHYFRCYELTGSPLGVPAPEMGSRAQLAVDRVTVQGTMANVLRNLSLHLGTPSEGINRGIEHIFRFAMQKIGADPDDPHTIWLGGHEKFQMAHFTTNETGAGNPIHLGLLILSIGLIPWKRREGVQPRAVWYGTGIILAFVLSCALLRWQSWSGRFHTPLFVLGAALTGLVLERYFSRKVANGAMITLLAFAALFALTNKTRSLVPWSRVEDIYHPRSELYFADFHQKDAESFIYAADFLNSFDCNDIAIDAYTPNVDLLHSPKSWYVYPLFPLIHADGRTRKVWYTSVHNKSNRYADQFSHPAPCAVVCLDCADVPEKWAEYRGIGGRVSVFDYIVVFSGNGTTLNLPR